jgi:hypothetical protein
LELFFLSSSSEKFCRHCGAEIPPDGSFCPKCGSPISTAQAVPSPQARHRRAEKGEKREKEEKGEKEGEKQEEKEREGSVSGALFGGGVLIWLGVTFYLATSGQIAWSKWWPSFMVGLGVLLVLLGLYHSLRSRGMFPFIGMVIGGAIISLIGLSGFYSFSTDLWPVMIILLGIVVILFGLLGRRRVPKP